jgi:WD40 repeat protein/serine/threonine protein kinase
MDDLSGQALKGYELRDCIGIGGFGAVYRAYQPIIDREVAIKVILPIYASQPGFIRKFEAEARIVARLEHLHIVPLFDYWRDPQGAFLVMRWLRHGSLMEKLKQGPLGLDLTARLLDQITSALSFAHNNGVVHRDIKPANILLDESDNFYLTDFGLATLIGTEQNDGTVQGSLAYIAPEQLQERSASVSSDVYSLGIVLYEILTAQHPFGDVTLEQLISKQLLASLPDLQLARTDLPEALNIIIQRATLKAPEDRYQDIQMLAGAFRRAIANGESQLIVPPRPTISITENPYKGLHPFEEADADDFFGRDALVKQLRGRLQERTPNNRFLAVVGPSGSGKSSVIHAGLLPRLHRGDIPGSEDWFVVNMVPGDQPFLNLEAALLSVAATPIPNLQEHLRTDNKRLFQVASDLLAQSQSDGDLLLIIDQFEELFTLAEDENQIKHFLDLLRVAVSTQNSRIRVIIALRADFYDRPLLYKDFAALIQSRTQAVIPLTTKELEQAIVGPAERIGMTVETDLVNRIITDVREEPGALPLLQYALSEVFERRDNNRLSLTAYQESGGVLGALARRAEEVYLGLKSADRDIARQLILRLVTLGEGTEDTRRRVRHSELAAFVSSPTEMQAILDVFGQYRLFTFDHDRDTREPTIEVAHEALIRTWRRLREWLDESRDDIRLQRLLALADIEWRNNNRRVDFLLHGGRLAQFEEWSNATNVALTRDEQEFLTASIAERQRQEAEETSRQAHERKLERRARQSLQVIVGVLLVASIVGFYFLLAISDKNQVAERERDNAQNARATSDANLALAEYEAEISRSLALANGAEALLRGDEPHPDIALALAIEAVNIDTPPAEANLALANAASLSRIRQRFLEAANVKGVAVSPDGKVALLALVNGTIVMRDLETGAVIRTLVAHSDSVNTIVFSPDGQTALSGSSDYSLVLWDVATGEVIRRMEGHSGDVQRVTFSPDGQTALSASYDQQIIRWDVNTGEDLQHYTGHENSVMDVAISPDGKSALSASYDLTAILWDIKTGEIIHQFTDFTRPVLAVAFHPNGQEAMITNDEDIFLVDLTSYTTIRELKGHSSTLNRAIFGPDGETILSVTGSVEFFLWDVETATILHKFQGHRGPIDDVALTPDGRHAITGAADRSMVLWDMENEDIIYHLMEHGRSVRSVAFSPDGSTFISASKDRKAIVWDATTGQSIRTLEGHSDGLQGVVYSPDGKTALTCSSDRTLILWDIETGEILQTFEGHEDDVYKAAFSPDGRTAISGSGDRTVILWDIETGDMLLRLEGHGDEVRDVAFSPDGETILSGSLDGTVLLRDSSTGAIIHRLEEHTSEVLAVAYSPDGQTVLSGSGDNTVILWDVATGQLLHRYRGHGGAVLGGVAYSPDGRLMLSGSTDNTVILWDVATGAVLHRYRGHVELVLDVAFSPDGRTAVSASSDDTVILWDIATFAEGTLDWAQQNRYIDDLTCDQRATYHIEPLCDAGSQ